MEIGNHYIFYDGDIPHVGNYVGTIPLESTEAVHVFRMFDGGYKFSNAIHDELNIMNTSELFIKEIHRRFNLIKADITHNDYEFKIVIRRNINPVSLDDIESAMNDVLEDFWSVQWEELRENNISVHNYEVIATFRIHDIHEAEMRFNDKRL